MERELLSSARAPVLFESVPEPGDVLPRTPPAGRVPAQLDAARGILFGTGAGAALWLAGLGLWALL